MIIRPAGKKGLFGIQLSEKPKTKLAHCYICGKETTKEFYEYGEIRMWECKNPEHDAIVLDRLAIRKLDLQYAEELEKIKKEMNNE